MFFIEYCTVLVEPPMKSSLSFFELIKPKYLLTKKDIPNRKTPFFFSLKSLSNKQRLFFTLYVL